MTRLQTPLETGASFFRLWNAVGVRSLFLRKRDLTPTGSMRRYDRRMLALFDSLRHWLDGIAHLGTILAVAYLL